MTVSTYTNIPLKYSPKFIQDLVVARASTTTLTIGSGSCMDSTGEVNMVSDSTLTINSAVSGANGLDTGTIAASTGYYVHLITNPNQSVAYVPAGVISLSATAPVLPAGYTNFRCVGWEVMNGSTNWLISTNIGKGRERRKMWDTAISILSGGTATSLTSIGSLALAVIGFDDVLVKLQASVTPATANDTASFTPYGSTATVMASMAGSVAAKVNSGQLDVVAKLNTGVPSILYINSAASGSTNALVQGFSYTL